MKQNKIRIFLALIVLLWYCNEIQGQSWQSSKIYYGSNNKLVYAADSEKNVIPDFSYAGYKRGEAEIPSVNVVKTLSPVIGDNTANIQNAIDEVGAFTLDGNGFRGAIFLNPGVYRVSGTIALKYSGVILRGSGRSVDTSANTIIFGTGDTPHQRNLIVAGADASSFWRDSVSGTKTNITTQVVPVGSRVFEVESTTKYAVGDNIVIYHPCTDAWLQTVNYGDTHDTVLWKVNEHPIVYNRRIVAITGKQITIDAPVFDHLKRANSQSYIYKYGRANLKTNIGIENLRVDNEAIAVGDTDENHVWSSIELNQIEDSWVRNCTMIHFGQSGVITCTATRITVENCEALDPVSIITGERRYNFNTYTASQLILFKDCTASNGRHHFISNGHSYASGNVFLNCKSIGIYNASEGHRRWSQGFLFDNIENTNSHTTKYVLGLYDRGDYGTGHGWGLTHSVAWNCRVGANDIIVQKPPTGQNYAIGCFARKVTGAYPTAPFDEASGFIEGTNKDSLVPHSLYVAQLQERMLATKVNENNSTIIAPDDIEVIGSYPNPFNPSTSIEFLVGKREFVTITIFDSLGSEVAELYKGTFDKGKQKINWEPSTYRIKSGVYFCRISTKFSQKLIKLMYLK